MHQTIYTLDLHDLTGVATPVIFYSHWQLDIQGWISDMGIDGPTFVPKSGYFLPILVKVCPQKLAFSLLFGQFYEMAFLTKCWFFQTRNPPLSLFLAFLAVVFSQFCSKII